MPQSNTTPGEPFDVEQFARDTVRAIEFSDECADVLERQVVRIEEVIAARWPRRWLLLRRLRREIRASVRTWRPEHIPPGDFTARRIEWAGQQSVVIAEQHRRDRQRRAEGGQR